jgi:hypothetical protein
MQHRVAHIRRTAKSLQEFFAERDDRRARTRRTIEFGVSKKTINALA